MTRTTRLPIVRHNRANCPDASRLVYSAVRSPTAGASATLVAILAQGVDSVRSRPRLDRHLVGHADYLRPQGGRRPCVSLLIVPRPRRSVEQSAIKPGRA